MRVIYKIHYTLWLPNPWGLWLKGAVSLLWALDCFVGFYLTLPPPRSARDVQTRSRWQRWKSAWQIKRGASFIRMNFDLHRASGLWLWPVLFIVAFTGVYFNLKHEVFRPAVSLFARLTPEPETAFKHPQASLVTPALSLQQALSAATEHLPPEAASMRPYSIGRLAGAADIYRVRFAEDGYRSALRFRYEQVYVDSTTGALAARRGHVSGTPGDRFLLLQFPLHSGQILGLPGRILVCISGVATALLSITGLILWARKRRRQVRVEPVIPDDSLSGARGSKALPHAPELTS